MPEHGKIKVEWLDDDHGWIMDSAGNYLAEIVTKDEESRVLPSHRLRQDKIEHIVLAHNVHDELVKTLEKACRWIKEALAKAS